MQTLKINKIQAYRKALNLKQRDISSMLGISVVMYSKKERKETPFTDNEKVKLLKYFKKHFKDETIDSLFF